MTTRTPTTDQVRAFYIDDGLDYDVYHDHDPLRRVEQAAFAGRKFDAWLAAHTLTTQINAFRDCIEWLSNDAQLHGAAAELDEFLAEKYGEPTAEQLSAANAAREVEA